jgi:hypothetical protein
MYVGIKEEIACSRLLWTRISALVKGDAERSALKDRGYGR